MSQNLSDPPGGPRLRPGLGQPGRRAVLTWGALGLTGLAACDTAGLATDAPSSAPPEDSRAPVEQHPYKAALHVHSSFSEGIGSMHAQLVQAQRVELDVLWWTEHDWRMRAHGYRQRVAFDGLQEAEAGRQWTWTPETEGDPETATHEFVDSPASTRDAPGSKSLLLTVAGRESEDARHRLIGHAERDLYRTSLHGQVLTVDVFPIDLREGWLTVELVTSYRPETARRAGGRYTLGYRFGEAGSAETPLVQDTSATISHSVPLGRWTTVHLHPAEDLVAAWPDLDGRDAALWEVIVSAGCSAGGHASGHIDSLEFRRTAVEGDQQLQTQSEAIEGYRDEFPQVAQLLGLEVSRANPHICWYGGDVTIPIDPDDPVTPGGRDPDGVREIVELIHERGGVASYAHPFGVSSEPPESLPQDELLAPVRAYLITERALGCDLLEVGYPTRGGASLATHEALWDSCSAEGLFLTGIGVNDNHSGTNWIEAPNNFVTWIWADDLGELALVESLRRGRAYFGDPARFHGTLDLFAQGARMGTVVVTAQPSVQLTLHATELPGGSTLTLITFAMTEGTPSTGPETTRRSISPADFDAESRLTTELEVDTGVVARLSVQDVSGDVVALSNPLWFLPDGNGFDPPEHRRVHL